SRRGRDVEPTEAARIAAAVPAFVVARDHLPREAVQRRDRGDDALAQPRVLANLVDLGGVEWAELEQRRAADADHADVVQAEAERELRVVQDLGRSPAREQQRETGE